MIHNHEVAGSIPAPATRERQLDSSNCFFSLFCFVGKEKSIIFAVMKQIISAIVFLLSAISASSQDVVRLLEPVYADSADSYRQRVYVPQKWEKCRVVLFLERPLGSTSVFVNGVEAGGDTLLYVPHEIDVTKQIVAGQRNLIEIRVAGHGAQGVMGRVELRSQPRRLYISKLKTHPRPYKYTLGIDLELGGSSPNFGYYGLQTIIQRDGVDSAKIFIDEQGITGKQMSFSEMILDDNLFWDEFHPNIFRLAVSAGDDYQEYTFGMREAGVVDGQLFLNRHPIYLRGAVMDDYFPLWGRMPMDMTTWRGVFMGLRAWGINHVRFRGYCPPDAAFEAADKVGMYLQPEALSEAGVQQIAEAYGHHPSLVLIGLADKNYVYNDGVITPVALDQCVIMGRDIPAYKQGIEQRLLGGGSMHFLLTGFCDRKGDFSGVLHERSGDDEKSRISQFTQFCGPIVPLVKIPQSFGISRGDTLRMPVYVYNAMYGNLRNVRTNYYITDDSNRVLAGGLVASGDVRLDTICPVGQVVYEFDSVSTSRIISLTLMVGGPSVSNHWDINVEE